MHSATMISYKPVQTSGAWAQHVGNLLARAGVRAHQDLDMLIPVRDKLIEAFRYNVVNVNLARDHGV